jgi:hypothetical protein
VTCEEEKQEQQALHKQRKQQKEQQRQALPFLTQQQSQSSSSSSIFPPKLSLTRAHTLYMLPKAWLEAWQYSVDRVDAKNASAVDTSPYICAHGGLKYDVTSIVAAALDPSLGPNPNPNPSPFVFLTESQWMQTLGHYSGDHSLPLKLKIQPQTDSSPKDSPNPNPNPRDFSLEPSVCHACAREQQLLDEQKQLSYNAATLSIVLRPTTTTTTTTTNSSNGGGRRTRGARPRKMTYKIDNVSSSQTLHTLKLQIFQETEIAPFQMNIYLDGLLLSNDEASLAQLKVFPTSFLELEKCEENQQILEGQSPLFFFLFYF